MMDKQIVFDHGLLTMGGTQVDVGKYDTSMVGTYTDFDYSDRRQRRAIDQICQEGAPTGSWDPETSRKWNDRLNEIKASYSDNYLKYFMLLDITGKKDGQVYERRKQELEQAIPNQLRSLIGVDVHFTQSYRTFRDIPDGIEIMVTEDVELVLKL